MQKFCDRCRSFLLLEAIAKFSSRYCLQGGKRAINGGAITFDRAIQKRINKKSKNYAKSKVKRLSATLNIANLKER